MKKECGISDCKFVCTKDELGYQEVLDAFPCAERIAVITFNISGTQTALLNALKQTPDKTTITILTNIPERKETYRDENQRWIAQKKIEKYLTRLQPENFGKYSEVFFDFRNHGKLVATDKIAYVGSSNYSEASQRNYEFGIITKDASFIEYIFSELIPEIVADAKPYYLYNYIPLLVEAEQAFSAYHEKMLELHEQAYRFNDMAGDDKEKQWFYNDVEDTVTVATCNELLHLMSDLCGISGGIYDAISVISGCSEDLLEQVEAARDELFSMYKATEELLSSDAIYDMANFDISGRVNDLLQREYSAEAYEENLDYYVGLASVTANEEFQQLAQGAEEAMKEVVAKLKGFWSKYRAFLRSFNKFELKPENPAIDNT